MILLECIASLSGEHHSVKTFTDFSVYLTDMLTYGLMYFQVLGISASQLINHLFHYCCFFVCVCVFVKHCYYFTSSSVAAYPGQGHMGATFCPRNSSPEVKIYRDGYGSSKYGTTQTAISTPIPAYDQFSIASISTCMFFLTYGTTKCVL